MKKIFAVLMIFSMLLAANAMPIPATAASCYIYGSDSSGNNTWYCPDTQSTVSLPQGQTPSSSGSTPIETVTVTNGSNTGGYTTGTTDYLNSTSAYENSDITSPTYNLSPQTPTINADGTVTYPSSDQISLPQYNLTPQVPTIGADGTVTWSSGGSGSGTGGCTSDADVASGGCATNSSGTAVPSQAASCSSSSVGGSLGGIASQLGGTVNKLLGGGSSGSPYIAGNTNYLSGQIPTSELSSGAKAITYQVPTINSDGTVSYTTATAQPDSQSTGASQNWNSLTSDTGQNLTGSSGSSFGCLSNADSASGACASGSSAGGLITQLTGGSTSGGMINSLLSGGAGILGGVTNKLLGGGIVGQLGSIAVTGIAKSLLSSSGIGSALGSAGGALGLAGGGLGVGAVPVSDSSLQSITSKVQSNTQQIQRDQDTQLQVTCVQNVLVRSLSHQFATTFAQTVLNAFTKGNGGLPQYSQNIGNDNQVISNTVANDFIKNVLPAVLGSNSPYLSQIQKNVSQQYQYNTGLQNQLSCPIPNAAACWNNYAQCGSTAIARQETRYEITVLYPQCNPVAAQQIAQSALENSVSSRINEQNQLLQQAGGVLPKITCLYPAGNNIPLQQCITYQVVSPAGSVAATANQATSIGAEQQARASQVGDLVTNLFAQLAGQVLTSLTGVLGLSQQNSSGLGSYLSQASATSAAATLAQAQSSLQADIQNSLGVEGAYQAVVGDLLKDFQVAQASEQGVESCYLTLATTTGATIDNITALGTANTASTTLASFLNPQIQAGNALLVASGQGLSVLNALDNQVQAATTATVVNSIESTYQGLVQAGAFPNTNDLSVMTTNRDTAAATLQSMVSQAATSLNACK